MVAEIQSYLQDILDAYDGTLSEQDIIAAKKGVITSPVYTPGGAMGSANPELTGHITNNTDLVMAMVREVIGSVAANFSADINSSDYTGHSLENAYLI